MKSKSKRNKHILKGGIDNEKNDGTPGELTALYYAQRASMGLIISEGTQPSEDSQGYLWSPGIYNDAQIEGGKKVINAVHEKGAYMYIQLMHAGRMSHPDNTPHGRQAVAPSAVSPGVPMFTKSGMPYRILYVFVLSPYIYCIHSDKQKRN
jgi:2,4-dienoyl-CoA reductase-like NADH-dependent reductase (Old Yellow Enzyme family)